MVFQLLISRGGYMTTLIILTLRFNLQYNVVLWLTQMRALALVMLLRSTNLY